MPKYQVDVSQTVHEGATLFVLAHSAEQAELITQYICENGKDPWDRKAIDVTWSATEVQGDAEVISCSEAPEHIGVPCNTMPEHTEGLFADDSE